MTGMGYCAWCKTEVPTIELLVHATQAHKFEVPRWPDGGLVVTDLAPVSADFMEDRAREFFAAIPRTRWERLCSRLKALLRLP